MVYIEGLEILKNTTFDNLDDITNGGLSTLEIVDGQLHIVGDDGNSCSVGAESSRQIDNGELFNTNGIVSVISGEVWVRLANPGPGQDIVNLPVGTYVLDTTRRRTVQSSANLVFEVLVDGTEAYFDNFSLKQVLSGGIFMPAAAGFGWIDFDGDTRQFTLPIADADAATHDARLAEVVALEDSIEAISELNLTRTDFIIERDDTGAGKPSVQAAQVNIEWKVIYVDDTTGALETLRIGGAKLTLADVLLPGSNVADLSQTEMAAFVTAFEALVLSDAGNAVSIQQVAFLE